VRTGLRALALAAAALTLAGPPLRADKFEDSLNLAKANAATPAGREFEQRVAERFDEKKLRDALLACADSAREEDVVPFMVLLQLGVDGRASQVLLRPPVPVAVCLRWTVRETSFPRPPSPAYWVMVDVSPRRAAGVPPIPTPGVATATVPPTRTPAAPRLPPPPPAVSTAASPSPIATPSWPAPTPTPTPLVPAAALASTPAVPPIIDLAGSPADDPATREARARLGIIKTIPATGLHVDGRRPDVGELRRRLKESRAEMLGPLLAQEDGVAPDDPRLETYWSLAEELDIPVSIRLGPEAPGETPAPRYRASLGDPLKLETALLRHPKLRVVVSGAGWPMGDATVALMWRYPRVSVDTGIIAWSLPRSEFHAYLRRLVGAAFTGRILFASGAAGGRIAASIEAIDSADFLTEAQKRDILYGNADRLLKEAASPALRP